MIKFIEDKKIFHLQTNNTSYIIEILPSKHLGSLYYGEKIDFENDYERLKLKLGLEMGGQVAYDESDKVFNLNTAFLEAPTYGKGDFREPMVHLRHRDGSRITDFVFHSYKLLDHKPKINNLPETRAFNKETLKITLKDKARNIFLNLYYTPIQEIDIIARRAELVNNTENDVLIEKIMSFNLDILNQDYYLKTFDGAWIKERQINNQKIYPGIYKIDSKKGVSSADHNPFIILGKEFTDENLGPAYGFSLIYSGGFEALLEVNPVSILRIQMGINSFDFYWNLKSQETFYTPEVLMSFSSSGFNRLSLNFHDLINQYIIKPEFKDKKRPVLFNNWEATMFSFSQRKLIKLAKKAKSLGMEMFVLDDGWFGERNDDKAGLGDWYCNKKKIPLGIEGLAKKINKLGLEFGIWVEPEMINYNSKLYNEHPEWVIRHPNFKPSLGRNQLILDLANPEVVDYLDNVLSKLFSEANIAYCKWDMNRNFSDIYSQNITAENQGKLLHLYMLGLYDLLNRLTNKFPHVLFEACASGGNRFDLGMLYYMPQIWTSDNTDAHSRFLIQYGTYYGYKQSVIGAHVSDSPSQQVLRKTPLETRFNVSAFGLLGYELDITKLTKFESEVIKKQILYYKKHQELLQFGDLYRLKNPFTTNEMQVITVDKEKREAILGIFQTLEVPNAKFDLIKLPMLDKNKTYKISVRKQYFNLDMFGYLIKHALPIKINAKSILFHLIKNRYLFSAEEDTQIVKGEVLVNKGFIPKQPYLGTGYNENIRLMGDFGSRLYYICEVNNDAKG
ncbi:MAG: alpha-galactosidase [Candidatus Izemoplasmatales bacterium]